MTPAPLPEMKMKWRWDEKKYTLTKRIPEDLCCSVKETILFDSKNSCDSGVLVDFVLERPLMKKNKHFMIEARGRGDRIPLIKERGCLSFCILSSDDWVAWLLRRWASPVFSKTWYSAKSIGRERDYFMTEEKGEKHIWNISFAPDRSKSKVQMD